MADFKEKTQSFVFGLLVGLLIAGSFFIFKLDAYIEKLKLYKNITRTFYVDNSKNKIQSDDNTSYKEEFKNSSSKSSKTKKSLNSLNTSNPVIQTDSAVVNSPSENDSLKAIEFVDKEENIIIEKDQMMTASIITITNLNVTFPNDNNSDSLIKKISKVRDDDNLTKRNITVEIWKSPLHYKGYKMTKNKVILYGLPSEEKIKLYKLDNIVYLKTTSNIYKLDQAYEFKPYQFVDDIAIANKLK